MPDLHAVVAEHLAAFNAHDTSRLLAGVTDDVRWATGRDVITGRDELADVFDDGLWELHPHLDLRRLVVGDGAAAELVEQLTVDDERRTFAVAAFFTVRDGLIAEVKVYREGSADID